METARAAISQPHRSYRVLHGFSWTEASVYSRDHHRIHYL